MENKTLIIFPVVFFAVDTSFGSEKDYLWELFNTYTLSTELLILGKGQF